MSWDQQVFSFGNPNAQPPTPTQTPTSAQFPSPTFETPRNVSNVENRSGWTPTFAEDYSVFNSTPGRLTGDRHSFVDFATPQDSSLSIQNRGLSSASDAATTELAAHGQHLQNSSGTIALVDSSNQLSSPAPYPTTRGRLDDSSKKKVTPRKPRKRLEEAFSGQTATPPNSATKGSRKLAPKILTGIMQNDSHESQYGISSTQTHHPDMLSFPSASADMFGYPLSAPATAPAFTNTKPFWDPDTSMSGMDLDYSAEDASMFHNGSHKISNSFDWGRNNQMFQEGVALSVNQSNQPPAKRQRPLAPKGPMVKTTEVSTSLPPFDFNSCSNVDTPASDDLFSIAPSAGVDPGLLYSRHNSVCVSSALENISAPATRPVTSHVARGPYEHQLRESRRDQEELRSRNLHENLAGHHLDRGTASSPIRNYTRPGLQRSFSENQGRKTQGEKFGIPSKLLGFLTEAQGRPLIAHTGRSSPTKSKRPNKLTSIPELPAPKPRTEVVFTIDSKGKARTETVVVGQAPELAHAENNTSSLNDEWESSQYESSTDEEPIVLAGVNASFNFPSQTKGPRLARFEISNHSIDARIQSTAGSSYSRSESSSQHSAHAEGVESEAETMMEDDGSGDATRELRKLVEGRKKRKAKERSPRHHRYSSITNGRSKTHYHSSTNNLSPTTVTDPEGATPSSTRSGTTRCVCNNAESEGDFMIQCESCDNWLHCQCVNIDHRSLPPVYICAFCAQTPNKRGGRVREAVRSVAHSASSPLAHKSFRSFR